MPASPTIPTTRPRPLAATASSPSSVSSSRCRPTNVVRRLRWSKAARGRWTRRSVWRSADRRLATSTNLRESSAPTDSATTTVSGSASATSASMSVMIRCRASASIRVPSGSTARGTVATWSAAWTPAGGPSSRAAVTAASAAWAARSGTSPVGVVPNEASHVRESLALQPAPERSHRVGHPLEAARAGRGRPCVVPDESDPEQPDVPVLPAGRRGRRSAPVGRRWRRHVTSRRESQATHAVAERVARNAEPRRRLHDVAARRLERGENGVRAGRSPEHSRAGNGARPGRGRRARRGRRRRVEHEGGGGDLASVSEQARRARSRSPARARCPATRARAGPPALRARKRMGPSP